jgi:3',5'-cyclic AMP phosphodiesterase CpdA
MKKYFRLSTLILIINCFFFVSLAQQFKKDFEESNEFSFIFMTDIHLQPERNANEGFTQAINRVNKLKPDFVLTGGDLIMDALGQSFGRADSLYKLYQTTSEFFNMPVYNTLGNHEIFGIYKKSMVPEDHPEYGEKMFKNRLGDSYYSFDHKGWHFIILNSVEDTGEDRYIGLVDKPQMEWIKEDLSKLDKEMPIVISTHIPFVTSFMQINYGSLKPNSDNLVVINSKEVLELFEDYNLKLVLQGHLHYLEDIYTQSIHFITGGAVSSRWWQGKENGLEEGFLMINVKDKDFSWKYIDYGWEVVEN